AQTPLVDVRSTSRQANIRAEQVELLPKGRDFTTMVTQAPGANQESKLGGISIDGASAGENRYIIDGIETTNLVSGTSGKRLISDFVEEVQVKSSGYTAEFGGATGGVINAMTKSGTNEMHGSGIFNYQSSSLAGSPTPTLRRNLVNDDIAEYITYPKDDEKRTEPGFTLGGPLVRDRAWFFGAYLPVMETTTRNVSPTSAGNPAAGTASVEQKTPAQNLTANITAQLSNSLRGRVSYNNSWRETNGLLPALTGTDPAGTNYTKTSKYPNYSVSGNLDWVASPRFFLGMRGGYYMADQNDSNVTEEPRIIFSTGNNIGLLDTPVSLQRASGFQNLPSNTKVTRDQQTRLYFQADGTMYANAGGAHQIKFGVQADQVGNNVLSGESANLVRIRWNTALGGLRGPYGYYQVRSNGVNPKQGFITEGDVTTTNIGLFIQ
ncbi:MAG: TonB-dependent receptor plug domain-containing protein, partial [Acidobacteriota bacterium]|nr:TonB-dependent receptor plug domain-containing protein [Acidobacteriota bacterium]